ncbi:YecA family protein [Alkaliphilus transvaalensis]|uniref:YecA family protein n=1 Tax=Alkaliphilus transvaalensis TaxID=114628 RepID=UPI00047A4509|nr:SEC-C metal-binding domain-containing protein [Alkaliphilus transvaalensis]
MTDKIGRNDRCYCGSEKKYKNCCSRNNDELKKLEREISKQMSFYLKEHDLKLCLHPDKASCSNRIIKAHSIQNNRILNRLSYKGKLVMPIPKPKDIISGGWSQWGRGQATTFKGFCSHHDLSLFRLIDESKFDYSAEHVFLHTYRNLSHELYKKMLGFKRISSWFQGQLEKDRLKRDITRAFFTDIRCLMYVKEVLDSGIQSQNYESLSYKIWEVEQEIFFAASGFFAPQKDLKLNNIQKTTNSLEDELKYIFFSVFPCEEKSYILISWLKNHDCELKYFVNQINDLSEEKRLSYLSNMIVVATENIVINPIKWENTSIELRKALQKFYEDTLYKVEENHYSMLVNNNKFNLFDFA